MVNGCVILSAPKIRKWVNGRNFIYVDDLCEDKGWELKMYRERMKKKEAEIAQPEAEPIEHIHIGFAGSDRMPKEQRQALRTLLMQIRGDKDPVFFRHTGLVGAPEQAHEIALRCDLHVLVHPSSDPEEEQAGCEGTFSILPVKPARERNLRLLEKSHILLACPDGFGEGQSAVWQMVKAANGVGCPVRVIFPDGTWRSGTRKG